jgi:hypothetical protein
MARSLLAAPRRRMTSRTGQGPRHARRGPVFGVGRWPIHAYFIALVLLFVVVAGAGALYVKSQSSRDARRSAQADASFAARKAAKQLDTYFAAIHGSVAGLVANPLIANSLSHPKGCTLSFSGVGGPDSGHLDIIRADGSVACSSRPHTPGARLSGYASA